MWTVTLNFDLATSFLHTTRWLFWPERPFETVFQSISGRLPERGRKKREVIDERKNVQTTPPAPIESTVGPCPTVIQISRTPRHWKFTQHLCTTRPPLDTSSCRDDHLCQNIFKSHQFSNKVIGWTRFWKAKNKFAGCGWSRGAMGLPNFPVPGRPANLDYKRARAFFTCSRCGWGLFGHFTLVFLFTSISPSLSETVRYNLKYCLKGPLNHNQPTNLALWPTEVVLACYTSSCFDDQLCLIIINSTMHDEVMVGHDSETRKL